MSNSGDRLIDIESCIATADGCSTGGWVHTGKVWVSWHYSFLMILSKVFDKMDILMSDKGETPVRVFLPTALRDAI